ncbi:MAG: ribonuclease III [Bacilli bacterium]|jgi:ribonuclease-3|nr:ribonuclease III [Bacilli bacterium]
MKILEELNIIPNNIELYENAFIHTSYSNENEFSGNYERLEFLGDRVIDLVVSEYLYRKCEIEEGEMTKIRASYVCENALYENALRLNFHEYVKVGKGEEASGGKEKKAILADIFEAFVAALYLDKGLNEVRRFLNFTVIASIEKNKEFFYDYKSVLQEYVQTGKKSIEYEVTDEYGPPHSKVFEIVVKVDKIALGRGTGSTKKQAEQNAAQDAIEKKAGIDKPLK